MTERDTTFSIIIPTYNRADFIEATIQSIAKQDYRFFEIIIVDDGSTDHTEEVVSKYNVDNLHYYKKENEERAAARNYGILKAKGDYITFIDSDDLVYENHFKEAINVINRYQRPEVFHLAYEIKDDQGNILHQNNQRKGDINKQLLKGNLLSCIGVFVKNEVIKANLFNPDRELSGSEDWELWMRLASKYPIYYSNVITACMIQHESRSVMQVDEKKLKKRIDLAYNYLLADPHFKNKYGRYKNLVRSHLLLYIALHLIIARSKKRGWAYVTQAIKINPNIIFSKKFLVILYKTLKNS